MEEINLKDLWNYYLSKYYIVLIAVVVCLLLGNIYLLGIQKPMYKSTTSLVLVSDNQSITQNDVTLNNNLVSTYSEIIKSRNVLEKVIKNLKLDKTAEELSKDVSVTSVTNTQLIKIEVRSDSKKQAKKIANEIATVFSNEIVNIYKIQNISIVDQAKLAKTAYNVNPLKQNLIYLIAGLVLGCGIVFIMFYFDTSIKDSKTVEEKLGLTVLGMVPKVGDSNER